MIEVQHPNGNIYEFPDDTTEDVMRNALASVQAAEPAPVPAAAPPPAPVTKPSVARGVAAASTSALSRGVASIADTLQDAFFTKPPLGQFSGTSGITKPAEPIARPEGGTVMDPVIDAFRDVGNTETEVMARARPEGAIAGFAYDAGTALMQMVPSITVGAITKSPNLALTMMGIPAYGNAYEQALVDGRSRDEAKQDGVVAVMTELGPEKLFGVWEKALGVQSAKDLLATMGREMFSEITTEELNVAYEVLTGRYVGDTADLLARFGHAGLLGAVLGGGMSLPSYAGSKLGTRVPQDEPPAPAAEAPKEPQPEQTLEGVLKDALDQEAANQAQLPPIPQPTLIDPLQESTMAPQAAPQPEVVEETAPVREIKTVEQEQEPVQERTEPTVSDKVKQGAEQEAEAARVAEEQAAAARAEAEKPVDAWSMTEQERTAHQAKTKAQNEGQETKPINPNYTHRAYRKGKMFEALELEDGTWMVRRKPNHLARFGEWEAQETVDTMGLKPISRPSVRIKGVGTFKVGEKYEPGPKAPMDLLEQLARGPKLNREAFISEFGIDPADTKELRAAGLSGVFTDEGGLTPQGLMEWLVQENYLIDQGMIDNTESTVGIADAAELLDLAMSGERVVSHDLAGDEAAYQLALQEGIEELGNDFAENSVEALEDIDAGYQAEVPPEMSDAEIDALAEQYAQEKLNADEGTTQKPVQEGRESEKAAKQEPEAAPAEERKAEPDTRDAKRDRVEPAPDGGATSTKNAVAEAERTARGLDPVYKEARQSNDSQIERAEAAMRENPNLASEIINRLNNDVDPSISTLDEAVLFVHKVDLRIQAKKLADKASNEKMTEKARKDAAKEYGDLLAQMEEVDTATHRSGAVWGRLGQLRSRMLNEDYSFEAQARAARVALGRPLTAEESTFLDEQAKEIDRLTEENAKLEEKLQQARVEAQSQATFDILAEKYGAKPKKKKAKDLVKNLNRAADESRAWMKANMGRTNAGVDPTAYYHMARIGASHIANGIDTLVEWIAAMKKDLGAMFSQVEDEMGDLFIAAQDMVESERIETGEQAVADITVAAEALAEAEEPLDHRTVYNLARAFILQGVTSEQEVMSEVHKVVEQIWEGTTERDVRRAFSEYGQVKHPSKDADKKKLAELRVLVRLQESIDRLTENLAPLKTGQQRDKATQKIREKQKTLNYLLKRFERNNPVPNENKLATVNEQRVTRLKNRIEDLKKQIATGKKPEKGATVPDSAEVTKLKAQVAALNKRLQEIENAKNPPRTPAQKQLDQLGKIKANLDELLRLGAPQMKRKAFRPLTKEAAEMKKEIDTLREMIKQIRNERKPKVDPAQRREEAQLKQLEASIKRYEDRIKNGDFSALTKKGVAPSARVKAMRELRDERRRMYQAAKKANQPVRSPEEIYNSRRGQQLRRQLREVNQRRKNKDYAKRQRKPVPALTKENKKLAWDLMQAKMKFHEEVMSWDREQMTRVQKGFDAGRQAINLSRAAITSFDLSAVLRQGGFSMLSNPSTAIKAFMPMMRALRNDANANAVNDEIVNRQNFDLYQKAGLHLSEQDSAHPTKMEEVYMGRWQKKVPGIAASGRAYVTFLNKLRADSFDAAVDAFAKKGETLTIEEMKQLAHFINNATGRSDLGRFSVEGMSDVFFAPRWMISRFNMAFGIPLNLMLRTNKYSPRMRRHVASQYVKFLAGFATLYGLAALAFGGDADEDDPFFELDPRSTDFGKLKIGDTRLDMLAGMSQPIVFVSRMISGGKKNARGEIVALRDGWRFGVPDDMKVGFGMDNNWDVATRFMRSKFSPPMSATMNWFTGENVIGESYEDRGAFLRDVVGLPAEVADNPVLIEAMGMSTPLSIRDFVDAAQAHGYSKAAAFQLLATFGVSMNTYSTGGDDERKRPKREKRPSREKRPTRD